MKKFLIALMLAVSTFSFVNAQEDNADFQKNEIGFSTFHIGDDLTIRNGESFALNTYAKTSLYYRRFLKNNLALRFDANLGMTGNSGGSSLQFRGGVGIERFKDLGARFQWYNGMKLYGSFRQANELIDHSAYGLGLDIYSGIRFQLRKNISISTE